MTLRYYFQNLSWASALFLFITPIVGILLTAHHIANEGFMWPIWVMGAVFYAATVLGITAGYHRFFAHRAYDAKPWLQWLWAFMGAAAFQNSIWIWARDHRIHHRFVDTDNDPYSINKGFFFAHFGWMLLNKGPDVDLGPYGRDLSQNRVVTFQHKYYFIIAIAMCFGLPALIGYFMGSTLGGLAVGGFLRLAVVHHATFLINSWCHVFGKQTYTDTNSAKDSVIMALATFGEGYHNFHHYFDTDYRNGVKWYHWDPTKWTIRALSFTGGAYNLKRTPWSQIVSAQLQMDEKRLKNRLQSRWEGEFQNQMEQLKGRIETAHARFEELRKEYRELAQKYSDSSKARISELKLQARIAKIEFQAALDQWRAYNNFLLLHAASPA